MTPWEPRLNIRNVPVLEREPPPHKPLLDDHPRVSAYRSPPVSVLVLTQFEVAKLQKLAYDGKSRREDLDTAT